MLPYTTRQWWLFCFGPKRAWVGVRNDQTGERDRGVQYGLHTVTGLCGSPGGGEETATKICLSRLYAQNLSVIVGDREREKESDRWPGVRDGGVRGCHQCRFIWLGWDMGRVRRAGRTQVIRGCWQWCIRGLEDSRTDLCQSQLNIENEWSYVVYWGNMGSVHLQVRSVLERDNNRSLGRMLDSTEAT